MENNSLVTLANGVMDVRSELNYPNPARANCARRASAWPQGQRLLRVEGDSIRTWQLGPPTNSAAALVRF